MRCIRCWFDVHFNEREILQPRNKGTRALFRSVLPSHVGCFYSRVRVTGQKDPSRNIVDCVRAAESDKESAQESIRKITTDLTEITDPFTIFKSENQERSYLNFGMSIALWSLPFYSF